MWDTFGYTNLQSTRRGKETYRVRTFLVVLLAIHATTVDGPSDLRALVLAVGIHTNRAVYASKNLDYSGKKNQEGHLKRQIPMSTELRVVTTTCMGTDRFGADS
jgi:hypothetical protein